MNNESKNVIEIPREIGKLGMALGIGGVCGMVVDLGVGGMGLAAMGTAIAIPTVSVGTVLGVLGYGCYFLGRKLS